MIVSKIGGSSLSTANDFLNAARIVKSDKERKVIVVSAPGKRFKSDVKVTDLFISLFKKLSTGSDFTEDFKIIKERFENISSLLDNDEEIKEYLESLLFSLKNNTPGFDFLISRGEYLSAVIMAKLLNFKFVDAGDILFFNEKGKIDEEKSMKKTKEAYLKYKNMVVPGFYGRNFDGSIKTFPRGGSDITGSFLAAFLSASLYENMTDTEGLYYSPPQFIDEKKKVEKLSLKELRLLSRTGSRIFNEGAVCPLIKYNIPLEIKSTFKNKRGTFCKRDIEEPSKITGFGAIKNIRGNLSLIIVTGSSFKEGIYSACLLNALLLGGIPFCSVKYPKKVPGFSIKVKDTYFNEAFGIIYKRAMKF